MFLYNIEAGCFTKLFNFHGESYNSEKKWKRSAFHKVGPSVVTLCRCRRQVNKSQSQIFSGFSVPKTITIGSIFDWVIQKNNEKEAFLVFFAGRVLRFPARLSQTIFLFHVASCMERSASQQPVKSVACYLQVETVWHCLLLTAFYCV